MDIHEKLEKLKETATLEEKEKKELEHTISNYPTYLLPRILYVLYLKEQNNINYPRELRRLAYLMPNRKQLLRYFEPNIVPIIIETQQSAKKEPEDNFALIENYLAANAEKSENYTEIQLTANDYFAKMSDKTSSKGETPTKQDDIIDTFLQNAENNPFLIAPNLESKPLDNEETTDTLDDDAYFTETLAKIYIRQKKYEKALEIIKRISLKYPKKNSYFADQIRFLEKLIVNVKRNI